MIPGSLEWRGGVLCFSSCLLPQAAPHCGPKLFLCTLGSHFPLWVDVLMRPVLTCGLLLQFPCAMSSCLPLCCLQPANIHLGLNQPLSIHPALSLGLDQLMGKLAGMVLSSAPGGCSVSLALDQPSEHPASLAASSCAHTGSYSPVSRCRLNTAMASCLQTL